jgi:hypothetical protein
VQSAAKEGVVNDANEPLGDTKFTETRTPPSVAASFAGRRGPVDGAITRRCVAVERRTESDGVPEAERAPSARASSEARAGAQPTSLTDDQTDAFAGVDRADRAAHSALAEPATASSNESDDETPAPAPATPVNTPFVTALSEKIDASRGHDAGSESAGVTRVDEAP